MHKCREIAKLLDRYSDGELDASRCLQVEAHLQNCELCSQLMSFREHETRLVRSSSPVPELSPGFSRQVMDSLIKTERARASREGFLRLGKVFARPWLAPALAGLVLLAGVSYAASVRLITPNSGQVAMQNRSQASQAAPPTTGERGSLAPNPAPDGDKSLTLYDHLVSGPGAQQDSSATKDGPASPESDRAITAPTAPTAPKESRGVILGGGTKGIEPDVQAPAPSILSLSPQPMSPEALEQAGYTVFTPDYLPAGYSLEKIAPLPVDKGGVSTQEPLPPAPGSQALLVSFLNSQTGERMTLEIASLNGPDPRADQNAKAPAAPGSQPPGGNNQITWYAKKHGNVFMLKLSGSIPYPELKKVADLVR